MYALLSGVRVIEVAAFVAGPSCGLHLAQMGAEVIRVDPPRGGPDFRRWPVTPGGDSLYWEGLNKAKRSIVIDTARPEGRELVLAMATAPGEGAGLLVTNLPKRSFLSHAALTERRADAISLRIAGWADGRPAVDYTVNAAVGIPMMTGPADDDRPVNHVLPAWDLVTGSYASFALLAALHHRRGGGGGTEIVLPLADVAATTLGHLGQVAEALTQGDRPRMGNDLFGAFGRDFLAADGERLIVVAITPRQWRGLVEVLDIAGPVAALEAETGADLTIDEGARFMLRDRLFPLVEAAIATRPAAEWEARFDKAGVTWGRYRTLYRAATEQGGPFAGNPAFADARHPSGLSYPAAGPAATLADMPRGTIGTAPVLGADTDRVLAETLGLGDGAIAGLHDRGIVR